MQTLTFSNLLISFIAGFFTFFAGCLAPMAVIYVGYLAGISPKDKKYDKYIFVKNTLFFTISFSLVFFIMGISVQTTGKFLAVYQKQIVTMTGFMLILIGLVMTQLIRIPILSSTFIINRPKPKATILSSVLMGITFAFSWSPCIGPVLAAILFWASRETTALQGGVLLIAFSIGLGLPFFLLGLLFETFFTFIKRIERLAHVIKLLAGLMLILFGISLVTGVFSYVSAFFLKNMGNWSYTINF